MIDIIKLDYTIQSPEERLKLVEKILEENPHPNEQYLEILADYLVLCMEKQEKKEKKIMTANRMATVNKREVSFEGIVSKLENGEDGIYNLVNNSKTIIFQPKVTITKLDLIEIPFLQQLKDTIELWEEKLKHAEGRDAFIIKKSLIEMRKEQYLIKDAYRRPIVLKNITHSAAHNDYDSSFTFDEDGYIIPEGASLCDPEICSIILCNYSKLKEAAFGNFEGGLWYLLVSFEETCDKALAAHPIYKRIVEYKIDGLQNVDIQTKIVGEFGIKHSLEYISSLWRKKIPNLIASMAEDMELDNYYLNIKKENIKM